VVDARSTRLLKLLGAPLVLAVVIVLVLLATRPGEAAMAEALFARIDEHITEGYPGDLVDEIDGQYDVRSHWPGVGHLDRLWREAQQRVADHDGADVQPSFRDKLRKTINLYLIRVRGPDTSVTYEIHEVGEVTEDSTFPATVSISIDGVRPAVAVERHRFTLSIHGWLRPVARIRSHAPMRLN